MNSITVDLNTIRTDRAEMICGFILAMARANESGFVGEPDEISGEEIRDLKTAPAPPAIDPAAAFGTVATGKISDSGPTLVIPNDPAPVPTQPAAVTVPPSGGVTLDKDGLPWDVRIHASSRAQNADGTWRLKRGLADDFKNKVIAELRQVMAIPSPAPAAGPQLVPPPPPAAVPPPPPTPAVANETEARDQYIKLFGRVSAAMSSGKLTQAQLDTCLTSIGIPSLPLLGARMDLVPQACALIDGVIAGASA